MSRPDEPTKEPSTPDRTPVPPAVPPRRGRRWLRWTLRLLAILIIPLTLGALIAWYAVSSESGTRFLLARVAPCCRGS